MSHHVSIDLDAAFLRADFTNSGSDRQTYKRGPCDDIATCSNKQISTYSEHWKVMAAKADVMEVMLRVVLELDACTLHLCIGDPRKKEV
jgi:hypothetical protein